VQRHHSLSVEAQKSTPDTNTSRYVDQNPPTCQVLAAWSLQARYHTGGTSHLKDTNTSKCTNSNYGNYQSVAEPFDIKLGPSEPGSRK
ncbi:hypothetical protein FRB93_001884, partial [Tulasnella sp. JGI-2019a]